MLASDSRFNIFKALQFHAPGTRVRDGQKGKFFFSHMPIDSIQSQKLHTLFSLEIKVGKTNDNR